MKKYKVIGLMSGTSLDGLDIACCEFVKDKTKWTWHIRKAETIPYSPGIKKRLTQAGNTTAIGLLETHTWFGTWQGNQVNAFIKKHRLQAPDLICAHGHTVFHQPARGLTLQIGSGAALAAVCGTDTVCDFRSLDVALGGQGAPLVPIGDDLLFPAYDYCLNLGGFANISFRQQGKRIAYDVCPVNIVLNELSSKKGKAYDRNGALACKGTVSASLLKTLDSASYYTRKGPKSLGKEWVDKEVLPLLSKNKESIENKLHTYVEHIARQLGKELKGKNKHILVTGGGAWNTYLMERIQYHCESVIILPEPGLIAFKEALIFAFLGLLRYCNETNTLQSVTGARRNSTGGCIYTGKTV
jgi:anhydro-N-acetylmuramic acid kinase